MIKQGFIFSSSLNPNAIITTTENKYFLSFPLKSIKILSLYDSSFNDNINQIPYKVY